MLVVLIVVDQIAHVLQPGRRFQQRPIRRVEAEHVDQLRKDQAGHAGHVPAVLQFAAGSWRPDVRWPLSRSWRLPPGAAERLIDHRQQQPVAHATVVNLHAVDLQPIHQAIDDRQAGDDDVGPIGAQPGHGARDRCSGILRSRSSRWRTSARVTW